MKEEESHEEEGTKLEQEEKGSIDDVVTQADEAELLLVKRVFFFWHPRNDRRTQRKPLSHPRRENHYLYPLCCFRTSPKRRQRKLVQLRLFTFSQRSLKVPRNFREWKIIAQTEWKASFFEDEFFKSLVMVFCLSKAPFECRG